MPSSGTSGGNHNSPQGEFAEDLVSSQGFGRGGSKVTLPLPLYTFQDRNKPFIFSTVTLVGLRIIRWFNSSEVFVDSRLGFGKPSSHTWVVRLIGSPTRATLTWSPGTVTTGGILALDSGLLVPAPREPVSEAITMLSTR